MFSVYLVFFFKSEFFMLICFSKRAETSEGEPLFHVPRFVCSLTWKVFPGGLGGLILVPAVDFYSKYGWSTQMVANSKGNPREFQGNLGWWNIIPFGQKDGIGTWILFDPGGVWILMVGRQSGFCLREFSGAWALKTPELSMDLVYLYENALNCPVL